MIKVTTTIQLGAQEVIAVLRAAGYKVNDNAKVRFTADYHGDQREPGGSPGHVVVEWKEV